MNPLSKILSSGIGELVGKISEVVDKFHTSGEEKLAASIKMQEAVQAFNVRMEELDVQLAQYQTQVVVAEATGHSWMQRNWRPVTMLAFVTVILYQFVIAPLFGLKTVPVLPNDLWLVIQIGIGGYIAGRSYEKGKEIAQK